jgi:phage tail-like protein
VAQTQKEQRGIHPLAAYNFRVTVDGVAMRFAKVSGLQREHKTVTYRHGLTFAEGEQIYKFFVDAYVSVTFEQGTVIGQSFLHEWVESSKKSSMEILLCDATGVPVIAWSIAKALPVKLTAPTFNAAANELVVDSLEIKAAGITIKHLS